MGVISAIPLDSGNTGLHPEGTGRNLLLEEEEVLHIPGIECMFGTAVLAPETTQGPGIGSDSVWTWVCAGLSPLSFLSQGYRG